VSNYPICPRPRVGDLDWASGGVLRNETFGSLSHCLKGGIERAIFGETLIVRASTSIKSFAFSSRRALFSRHRTAARQKRALAGGVFSLKGKRLILDVGDPNFSGLF